MTVDRDDEEAIRDDWALRDLWAASQMVSDPTMVLRRWIELTWAIYGTGVGRSIGIGRCSALSARVTADEVNCGL